MKKEIEVTFLLPCLNEEKTIKTTILEIKSLIKKYNLAAEILVVDNNSEDSSAKIALKTGARVIVEKERGYGKALQVGIKEANGKYIIMGDADTTYDFENSYPFIEKLREGYDLVIGNRYKGGMEKKAMSKSHYYGGKMLSFLSNRKANVPIYDFHCGLRGVNKEVIKNITFKTKGMEFATEMIMVASKYTDKIIEIPTKLKKCKIKRKSHLKTIQDGCKCLMYIIKY